jgi:hypothetical protein
VLNKRSAQDHLQAAHWLQNETDLITKRFSLRLSPRVRPIMKKKQRQNFRDWLSGGRDSKLYEGGPLVQSVTLGMDPQLHAAIASQNGQPLTNLPGSKEERLDQRFARYLLALLEDRDIVTVAVAPIAYGPLEILASNVPKYQIQFARFATESYTLLHSRKLKITNVECQGAGDIVMEDCLIRNLRVDGGARLELTRTWVLDLDIGRLKELKISGDGIYRPSFLPSEKEQPDAPYDISDDVEFPIRAPEGVPIGAGLPFGHPQPIREMNRHLRSRGDRAAMLRFLGLARQREAERGPWARRQIGRAYH